MKEPINVLVLNGPYCTYKTPEAEAADIVVELHDLLDYPIAYLGREISMVNSYVHDQTSIDVVAVDYSALGSIAGWQVTSTLLHYACQWAEAHPATLVILWTGFTAQMLKSTNPDTEQYINLPNVQPLYVQPLYPAWDDLRVNPAITGWFNSAAYRQAVNELVAATAQPGAPW